MKFLQQREHHCKVSEPKKGPSFVRYLACAVTDLATCLEFSSITGGRKKIRGRPCDTRAHEIILNNLAVMKLESKVMDILNPEPEEQLSTELMQRLI